MKPVFVFLGVILLAASAFSAGDTTNLPADWQLGRTFDLPDAKSVALGGVSAAIGSPFGFLANPALAIVRFDRFNVPALPETKARPTVGLTGNLGIGSERRTRMTYDIYNNAVGEIAIADNSAASPLAGPIAVQLPLGGLSLGLGMRPVNDFTYSFRQEVRDEFYQLLRVNEQQVSGQLVQAGGAVAYDLAGMVGIGAGLNYSFGERNLDSTRNDTLSIIHHTQLSGLGINGGLLIHPGNAVRIGVSFEPRIPKLGSLLVKPGDSAVTAADNPTRAKLGFSYFVAGSAPTGIYLQAGYTAWRDLDTMNLHSTIDLRAGVEHRLLNNIDLRYGFGLLPSPLDPGIQAGLLSLGVGIETDLAHIDLGGNLTRRMFANGALLPNQALSMRVYQTGWQLAVSISRGF
jgi:hypothetical protein